MKASSLSFQAAVLLVLVGMGWGIAMAASGDHSTMPAHAHLNLLGWVSLFLFGIFYHLHPAIDQSRAARLQVWRWPHPYGAGHRRPHCSGRFTRDLRRHGLLRLARVPQG